jgi:hypothetical protein
MITLMKESFHPFSVSDSFYMKMQKDGKQTYGKNRALNRACLLKNR